MQIYEVLRKPLITEKNTVLQAQGKYAFEVAANSNRTQVKEAVEKAFKVKVMSVNIMYVPGKSKRMGMRRLPAKSWKKAIVTLKAGDKIEFFAGV